MTCIVSRWEEGFDKVGFNVLLREYAGLSLGEAKRTVDEILDGKPVSVEIEGESSAAEFLRRARDLGAIADLVASRVN